MEPQSFEQDGDHYITVSEGFLAKWSDNCHLIKQPREATFGEPFEVKTTESMISNVFLPDSMEVIYVSNWGCLKKMVGPRVQFSSSTDLGCEKDSCHFKEVGALNSGKYPKVWYFGMTQRGLAASEMGREDLPGKPGRHVGFGGWGCLKTWNLKCRCFGGWSSWHSHVVVVVVLSLEPLEPLGSQVSRKIWWTKQRQRRKPWRRKPKLPDSAEKRHRVEGFGPNQISTTETFTSTANVFYYGYYG